MSGTVTVLTSTSSGATPAKSSANTKSQWKARARAADEENQKMASHMAEMEAELTAL